MPQEREHRLGAVVYSCNPGAGKAEIEGSLGHTGQPFELVSKLQIQCETLSQKLRGAGESAPWLAAPAALRVARAHFAVSTYIQPSVTLAWPLGTACMEAKHKINLRNEVGLTRWLSKYRHSIKPGEMSLIPETHMVGRVNFHKLSPGLHMHTMAFLSPSLKKKKSKK